MSPWLLALTLMFGCGGGEGAGEEAEACDLSLESLEGKTFIMDEAQPDGSSQPAPIARVKFQKGDTGLEAMYTAKSVSDVYTYACRAPEEEDGEMRMLCAEEERPKDWCQSLEVYEDGSCNRKALRKLGLEVTNDDDVRKAIKEARAEVKKAKEAGGRELKLFELNNHNLGNKLQGRIYLKVDDKRCKLSFTDMYFTIYEGKAVEDTNPVGINPFSETKDEWMFEHCDEGRNIVADLNDPEPPAKPEDIPAERPHELGKPVYYFYYGEKEAKAVEGCTYSADVWANWKSVAKDLPITPEENGNLLWRGTHTFNQGELVKVQGRDAAIYEMVRYKQCEGGEKEKINTVCNVFIP